MKKQSFGILLCFALAVPAWILGRLFPIIGGPVFGILIGMMIGFIKLPVIFESGIKYTSKKLLQFSIILLGFEMNLFHVVQVGKQSLLVIFFTLTSCFITAYLMGKFLKLEYNITTLIGVGTCICGGSAIAATAPVIGAKEEEIAQAISTIFLFNIAAVFLFPALGHALSLSDTGFGMWAGTAINDTSSVVAAGLSWSSSAGNNTALSFATIVKLTRTLMIIPITMLLAIYMSKKRNISSTYSISDVFPWFVLGFVATAVLNTFSYLPLEFSEALARFGKFVIVMAMTAIGLNTDLKKLLTNGLRPISLGLSCWFVVAVVSLLVQHCMKLL
ncbi:YeiH family protein [Sinanaerobacter sp. ZZT-01]|uniref:YeiH family protein n=1 Tax=Sinanaerobacter sp. ZZT-01 TaxID=3111540 RepID=UPI002D77A920|nr:YeiH family protein [Sinanaerobacter sp. ZZT-01]WRR92248.1 YeiH family protein [Sinanaerobacter sp. ZZT-01]